MSPDSYEQAVLSRAPMEVAPLQLEGNFIRLVPLSLSHLDQLADVAFDPELWRWTITQITTPAELQSYIETALKEQAAGTSLPFATVLKSNNQAIGSTRFGNIDRGNRHVEIGWTWLGRAWQRTAANTEAKLLMLRHAFDTLGCLRVELKTDSLNQRSRQAILRLGAKEEGIFRNHMITDSGRIRHSAYYSIICSEWPAVRDSLIEKLAQNYQ
jgi:RimJ/RimL family protein N-acetyltransferase